MASRERAAVPDELTVSGRALAVLPLRGAYPREGLASPHVILHESPRLFLQGAYMFGNEAVRDRWYTRQAVGWPRSGQRLLRCKLFRFRLIHGVLSCAFVPQELLGRLTLEQRTYQCGG